MRCRFYLLMGTSILATQLYANTKNNHPTPKKQHPPQKLTSEFTVMSDYVYRGISRTDHSPAVLGSMHYKIGHGFQAGASAANVGADENRGMEAQLDASFQHKFRKIFSAMGKVEYYHNPFSPSANTLTYTLGTTITRYLELKISYSPRYLGIGSSSTYFYGETSLPLFPSERLFFNLSVGYSSLGDETTAGTKSYLDYRISLHRRKPKEHDIAFFWVGTTRDFIDAKGVVSKARDDGFGATYTLKIR